MIGWSSSQAVRGGARVLDIATGSGEPALTAARAVGQSGRIVAVDMSPGMLAIARERVDAAGLRNVELVESDAESLSLDPRSFDAALCRWGLMFMPDLDGVLRLMHRALKPGGRFATAVWAAADKVPMCGLARDAIRQITGIAPPPNAPDPTKLADTSILERALAAAGFRDVTIERLIVTFEFPSAEGFADFRSQVGGTRAMLARMPADVSRQVRDAVVDVGGRVRRSGRRGETQQRDDLLRRARITRPPRARRTCSRLAFALLAGAGPLRNRNRGRAPA